MHSPSELNILIDGISATVTRSDIITLFSCCGTVTAAETVINADGIPMGIARVSMATKEEARCAIRTFHRCRFRGHTLLVFEDTTMNHREDLWQSRPPKQE